MDFREIVELMGLGIMLMVMGLEAKRGSSFIRCCRSDIIALGCDDIIG